MQVAFDWMFRAGFFILICHGVLKIEFGAKIYPEILSQYLHNGHILEHRCGALFIYSKRCKSFKARTHYICIWPALSSSIN